MKLFKKKIKYYAIMQRHNEDWYKLRDYKNSEKEIREEITKLRCENPFDEFHVFKHIDL